MILSEPHTPSSSPVASLSKVCIRELSASRLLLLTHLQMMLRDLSMETHHYGKMLVLRAVSVPSMHSSMQTCIAVEDEDGDHELLTMHDFAIPNHPSRVIQNGTFFVVKEPFFRTILDEACVLCVDHPSDVLFLDVDDPILPLAWRTSDIERSATDWKRAGNLALRSEDPFEAERWFVPPSLHFDNPH
jgi:hypothetical protein